MKESSAVSTRLIGEIFVERGIITHEQLDQALELQRESGSMLGEVLVASFGISRIDLAGVLAEQWSAMERQGELERAAEPVAPPPRAEDLDDEVDETTRRPIGEIFVERGMVTEEQLSHALQIQGESGERLGEILVRLGAIGRLELAGALAEQWSGLQKLRPPAPKQASTWQALAEQQSPRRRGVDDGPAPELARLEQTVASLELQVAALGSRPDFDLASVRAVTRAIDERLADVEQQVTGLPDGEVLAEIRGALDRLDTAADGAALATDVEAIRDQLSGLDVGSLRSRLDELTSHVTTLTGQLDAVGTHDLAAMRDDLSGSRRALDELATRLEERTSALADQVAATPGHDALDGLADDLRGRFERAEGLVDSLVGRVEEVAREGTPTVDAALADRPTRSELEALIAGLVARVDELAAAAGQPPSEGLAELAGRLAALEHGVADAARGTELAVLAGDLSIRLEDLGRGLETVRSEGAESLDGALLEHRHWLETIQTRVDETVGRAELAGLAGDLGARLDALAATVESDRGDSQPDARVEGLVDRLGVLEHGLGEAAGRVELAALAGDLRERFDSLSRVIDQAGLEELRSRLDALESVTARDAQLDDLATTLGELRHGHESLGVRVDEAAGRAELTALADDLRSGLTALREQIEAPRDGERLAALEHAEAELRSWLEAVQGRVDDPSPSGDLRTLHEHLDAIDARLGNTASHDALQGLAARLEGRIAGVEAVAGEQASVLASQAELSALAEDLDTRIRASSLAGMEGLSELGARLEGLAARLEGRIAQVESVAGEQASGAAVQAELAALAEDLDVRMSIASEAGVERVSQLGATLEGLAMEVRHGLGEMHVRVDELAAGLGHLSGRFASVEHGGSDRAALDALAGELGALRSEVERQAALDAERSHATERAIRKGLAGLGERLVASEQAYIEAGGSLRRAVERLGAAVVEADVRIAGAPLDPPGAGYVAFLPTADGYRLTSLAGSAPSVDELVEALPGEPPLRVVRVTVSPLPLDRRTCVYLER